MIRPTENIHLIPCHHLNYHFQTSSVRAPIQRIHFLTRGKLTRTNSCRIVGVRICRWYVVVIRIIQIIVVLWFIYYIARINSIVLFLLIHHTIGFRSSITIGTLQRGRWIIIYLLKVYRSLGFKN